MPAIVTFDGANRIITEISGGTDNELDLVEIYSEWKEWVKASPANAGIEAAFRVVGGDPVSGTQNLGSTFFLTNGWRIRPAELHHRLTIVGNLFTDPSGFSPFIATTGAYTVNAEIRVSNLIDTITGGGGGGATADQIWDEPLSGHAVAGTAGAALTQIQSLAKAILALSA